MLMSVAISYIMTVASGDKIGLMTQKADGFGVCPMFSAGTSFMTLKRVG